MCSRFPEPEAVSPPVLGFTDVDFNYPNGPKLFTKLNFGLDMESRLAIVRPNGASKKRLQNAVLVLCAALIADHTSLIRISSEVNTCCTASTT